MKFIGSPRKGPVKILRLGTELFTSPLQLLLQFVWRLGRASIRPVVTHLLCNGASDLVRRFFLHRGTEFNSQASIISQNRAFAHFYIARRE